MSYQPIVGRTINSDSLALSADVSTADTSSPPTVAFHTFSNFPKQSATSVLEVVITCSITNTATSGNRLRGFYGAAPTYIAGCKDYTVANQNTAVSLSFKVPAGSSGAIDIGIAWSCVSGTLACTTSSNPNFYHCNIKVDEVEPT